MKAERLQQAIIRSQVQTFHSLLHLAPSGQHQHGRLIEPSAQLRQHLCPVLPRQAQVEHNQIRPVLFGIYQCCLPVSHPGYFVALKLQPLL